MELSKVLVQPDFKKILNYALEIGKMLLENGAEITRVEGTISYICKAYGATSIDVFAIPTMISATVSFDEEYYTTKIRRIQSKGTNLNKIEILNQMSRWITKDKPSLDDVKTKIDEFKRMKYSKLDIFLQYVGAFLTCFGFAIYFGGTFLDGLTAGIISLVMLFILKMKKSLINMLLETFLAALVGGVLTVALCKMHIGDHMSYVMIGAIMILTPGMAVGTSFKDFIADDMLSGILRLVQSIMKTLSIGLGVFLAMIMFKGEFFFDMDEVNIWVKLISGLVATIGYALSSNSRYKTLVLIALGGLVTIVTLLTVGIGIDNALLLTFISALLTTIFAEVAARIKKIPAMIIIYPAIIVLAPGSKIYYAVISLVNGNYEAFGSNLLTVLYVSIGIGIGIAIGNLLVLLTLRAINNIKNIKRTNA